MTETARRLGGREVETVCDGIDRRFYYPPSQDALSTRANVILYAGSFRPYKRADLVVREAARFPPWEFRLAGTGEDEGTCRELALKANCTNIRFLGHLSARELGEEMRRAAIFFFPSELEGHPQVLGQAAACGLPCVARSSYRPDYVVHGVTGLLADSEGDLGAALGRLCGDHSLRAGMSQAAIAHTAKFEWDDITRQWAGIMEKAIVQRRNIRQRRVA
jgi:glycosyltransferase involved in cell wall biosynthesis